MQNRSYFTTGLDRLSVFALVVRTFSVILYASYTVSPEGGDMFHSEIEHVAAFINKPQFKHLFIHKWSKNVFMSESLNYTLNWLIQKTPIYLETELVEIFMSESVDSLNQFVQNTSSFRIERRDCLYDLYESSFHQLIHL